VRYFGLQVIILEGQPSGTYHHFARCPTIFHRITISIYHLLFRLTPDFGTGYRVASASGLSLVSALRALLELHNLKWVQSCSSDPQRFTATVPSDRHGYLASLLDF